MRTAYGKGWIVDKQVQNRGWEMSKEKLNMYKEMPTEHWKEKMEKIVRRL